MQNESNYVLNINEGKKGKAYYNSEDKIRKR